ncbi:MAG: penicillin-binding transpeptidase domain-containing protein [Solirubrobacteraceae bacterium]
MPLLIVAGLAFVVGVVVGALHTPGEQKVADAYAKAWAKGNYAAMYKLISDDAKRSVTPAAFRAAYQRSADTATATSTSVGQAKDPQDGAVAVPVKMKTRLWGEVGGTVTLRFQGSGDSAKVAWTPALTFPGLAEGQSLTRSTALAPRAPILATDGQALAKGPGRTSAIGDAASEIVGTLGPAPPARRARLFAQGYPADASVGLNGLERVFQSQLAGTPGGTLKAGGAIVARSRPRPGRAVRTTISPKLETAAANALANQDGGVAVLKPTGEILALSGQAFSVLQPPGSTFKIVTTTAALEERKVKLTDEFPVQTSANIEGFLLSNAGGEACGGTFLNSFAESCNSVFAPLGVKVGGAGLVKYAERFGFNRSPGIDGAETPSIPRTFTGDLDVGSSAIGQGKVQATALEMASIAATVATGGLRYQPRFVSKPTPKPTRVMSRRTAKTLTKLMTEVVKVGTGKNAQISGITVAGKTGTAELGGNLTDDAWFTSFAPAERPKIVVAVLRIEAGAGGDFAAPIARQVLVDALQK